MLIAKKYLRIELLTYRLTLQEERKNAEMINKQLEEEARSYQKTAREAEEGNGYMCNAYS